MQGAIVGFGSIAMGHLVGYSRVPDLSIVAVVDPSPARRSLAETSFGLRAYSSLDAAMAAEDLDFIDICTPPDTHGSYSVKGLVSDLHVLCEKPVFMPEEDGFEDLLREIAVSDRVFYPCHVYKFAPILGSMRSLTGAPGFGTVLSANFRTLRRGHAVGVPEWRPDWRREPEISGGGILRDHGPHSIYLALDLTGQRPLSVSCLMGSMSEDGHSGTEDTALLRLRCERDTEIALTLTWAAGYRSTTYSVVGQSGSVVVDGDDLVYTKGGEVVRSVIESGFDDPSHQEWFVDLLTDFLATVADRGRQSALIDEALVTAMVIDMAYRSAADGGRWMDIPPVPRTTVRSHEAQASLAT